MTEALCVRSRKPRKCRSPDWRQQKLPEDFSTEVVKGWVRETQRKKIFRVLWQSVFSQVDVPKGLGRMQVQSFLPLGWRDLSPVDVLRVWAGFFQLFSSSATSWRIKLKISQLVFLFLPSLYCSLWKMNYSFLPRVTRYWLLRWYIFLKTRNPTFSQSGWGLKDA